VSAGQAAPVLRVRNLSKQFTIRGSHKVVHACDDVSLEIRSGQTLGLIGESGSGKTTVGRCVLRLIDTTSGSVELDSVDIAALSDRELRELRQRMQIVFQEPAESFNPVLSVGNQIDLSLRASGLNAAERRRRVRELLERVGVPGAAAALRPGALPAGVLQKCSIARALASEPRLLVLDEPTSALAPEAEADVLGLLNQLQRDDGLAYLFISHDLSLVQSFCDLVAVMYLGQIVELGPKEQVYRSPRHPYTQALLAAVLRPDPRQRAERAAGGGELKGEIPSPIDLPTGCYLASRCKYATDRCRAERQELLQLGAGTVVRCWRAAELPALNGRPPSP
jgi:oligopeptide/dipeptide ABC transporter ATP-binding protein